MNNFFTPANAAAVTPSDTANFAQVSKALYVGGGGNVTVFTEGGQVVLYEDVPSGSWLFGRHIRVNYTGTTATGIVRHW